MPNKFNEGGDYNIPYSKRPLLVMGVGFVFFVFLASGLFFGTEFSKPDTTYSYSTIANYMFDYPVFRWISGIFLLCFASICIFSIYNLCAEKRPYLIFTSAGLIISNLMPAGYSPIPWSKIDGYTITSLPYTFWKNQIYLDVENYEQYTKKKLGSYPRPNILISMSEENLRNITLLIDHYIAKYGESKYDNKRG